MQSIACQTVRIHATRVSVKTATWDGHVQTSITVLIARARMEALVPMMTANRRSTRVSVWLAELEAPAWVFSRFNNYYKIIMLCDIVYKVVILVL